MAITATTLTGAIGISDLVLPVTSSTGATVGYPCKIDAEYIGAVTEIISSTSVRVRCRGWEGTAAVAHDALAYVQFASAIGDFGGYTPGADVPIMPFVDELVTLGQNQTLAVPVEDTRYIIDKATAAAIVIPAPSKTQDGLTLCFTSNTAAAHTITSAGLIADAVSGSPHSTATLAAFKGASITLEAVQGSWNVISQVGATVA